jgi:hypothetical protein
MPVLSAALSAVVVVAPQLLPSDPDSFCWRVTTTHDPSTHASYLQTATLCNNTGCPQVFRLAVQGPFQLVAAVPSVVQDADAFRCELPCMRLRRCWLQLPALFSLQIAPRPALSWNHGPVVYSCRAVLACLLLNTGACRAAAAWQPS